MFNFNRPQGIRAAAALALVAVMAAGCKGNESSTDLAITKAGQHGTITAADARGPAPNVSVATPPASATNFNLEKLTREFVPLDPDKDRGETSRINWRDGLNHLRRVEIAYKNKSRGTIWLDEHGGKTRVRMDREDGTYYEGVVNTQGVAISPAQAFSKEGKLLIEESSTGPNGAGFIYYYYPGTTAMRLNEVNDGNHRVQTLLAADGATPIAELEYFPGVLIRKAFRLYQSGTLIYEESGGLEQEAGVRRYAGTIFALDGKPTHRIVFFEGMYDQGGGKPSTVEVLDAHGHASQNIDLLLVREKDDPIQNPAATFNIGYWNSPAELSHGKRIVWEDLMKIRMTAVRMESDLLMLSNEKFNQ